MTSATKRFIISLMGGKHKKNREATFFERARRNIVKRKKHVGRDVSSRIDAIVYGAE